MGKREMYALILLGSLKGRDKFGDLSIDGRIILKRILKEWGGRLCAGFV
jgi:hypothetical protein